MADLSDVEQAIAEAVTAILYPAGSSQSSIVGALCRIYRGWPNSATLNADLNAGIVNVTIGTDNESGRTTTRYLPEWNTLQAQPGAIAFTGDQNFTVAGSAAAGDIVGVLINGVLFASRVQTLD